MKKPIVLVTIPVNEAHSEQLETAGTGCEFIYCAAASVDQELVQRAEVIIGNAPAEMIAGSPNLKWLQLNSAGTDQYVVPGVLPEGTILTNATGAYSKAVGEHMLAMTLCLQKKLHFYRDDQRDAVWGDHGTVTSIADATVLVLGAGDIGRHYGKLAKALGAHVIGVKRRPGACPEELDQLYTMEDLDKLLPEADVVASFLPNTSATEGLFNEERFNLMKQGSILVNGGRGNAVDQEALMKALTDGPLYGAALDVTNPEPLPADHPLWKMSNVLITPHVSGQYHLPETLDRIVHIAATNLAKYLQGEPLNNQVDFETGYCK